MRRFADAIDLELVQLDDLIDLAVSLAKVANAGVQLAPSDAAKVAEKRSRFGRRLRRVMGSDEHYDGIASALGVFSRHLSRLEPDTPGDRRADALQLEIDGQAVRAAIIQRAQKDLYWRLFRKL